MNNDNYLSAWQKFERGQTPSIIELDPIFYDYIPPEMKVLDFGSAWGRVPLQLQTKGYEVIGFDQNTREISRANEFASQTNQNFQNKVSFIVADARKLPFEDGRFDACIIQAFMASQVNPRDRIKILEEARRVLNKDDVLYMGVFGLTESNPKHLARYKHHESITGEYGTFIVYDSHEVTGDKELYRAHHYTRDELKALLSETGFKVIKIVKKRFKTTSSYSNGFIIIAKPVE